MLTTREAPTQPITEIAQWRIDDRHSKATFAVDNRLFSLVSTKVVGHFSEIRGSIRFDPARPRESRADLTITAATIATGLARRDRHLRSGHFFDIARFPDLRFVSTAVEVVDPGRGEYLVHGRLTIRDTSLAVTLDVQTSPASARASEPRLALTGTAVIDRRAFGMAWSRPPMSKPGNTVAITVHIEATPVSPTS